MITYVLFCRWKSLEDHDVIVLCAKMSIDQIEGTWEEMSCPVVSSSYRSIMSVEGGRKTSTSGMSGVLKNLAYHLL